MSICLWVVKNHIYFKTFNNNISVFSLVTQKNYMQYITTQQSFKYMELSDAKIQVPKNVSLCWVFTKQVTDRY